MVVPELTLMPPHLARENQTVWFAFPECPPLLPGKGTSPPGPRAAWGGSLQLTTERAESKLFLFFGKPLETGREVVF